MFDKFERSDVFQAICRFFVKRFIPRDDEIEFADALFLWKYPESRG